MWAPRWLRTLARRKDEENHPDKGDWTPPFASGGTIKGPVEGYGSDAVPYSFGEGGHHITPGEPRIKGRLIGDAYVRDEPDATRVRKDRRPIPAWSPRHNYGGNGTIHRTTTVDIQIDKITGEVHAVWFRCLQLPFTVSEVQNDTESNPINTMAIEEITYVELPSEEGSQ